jgi:hypothetical protein
VKSVKIKLMAEQLSFWGEKKKKEFKNISKPRIQLKANKLLIEFLVVRDNGDKIDLRFIFNLNRDKKQKPEIKKIIRMSYSRPFLNEASRVEVSEIEPKYFRYALRKAYAIFREKYKEYQDEQNRKSRQYKLPLK